MGNPIQLEVELAGQGKQVEEGDQIAASDSLERENPDAPLLSTKSRAEDLQREVFLQQARDEGQGVPRVSGEMESSVQRNGDSPRVVKVEEDVKPLLGNNGNNSSDEISAVSNGKERSSMSPIGEVEVTPEFTREMELKCAPYVRHDTYGNFGAAEIPVREKILLGLALVTIAPIRMILIFFILVTYYFICKICTVSRLPGEEEGQENYSHLTGLRRSVIVHAGKFLSRSLLFVVGFYRIKVTHRTPDVMQQLDLGVGERRNEDNEGLLETSQRNPGAIVSNHISYLDILYHMSASFPSFVAKRSVAKLPLVGLISKCMGCVYVQRESKSTNFKGVSGIWTSCRELLHATHDYALSENQSYSVEFKRYAVQQFNIWSGFSNHSRHRHRTHPSSTCKSGCPYAAPVSRRYDHKWRVSATIQNGRLSCRDSGSACDLEIPFQEVQSGLGIHNRGPTRSFPSMPICEPSGGREATSISPNCKGVFRSKTVRQ